MCVLLLQFHGDGSTDDQREDEIFRSGHVQHSNQNEQETQRLIAGEN